MKKTILIALMALIGLSAFAQSAQQVLDRTAKVIGNKSGASANFTISNAKIGSSSGTIAIKGNKFNARTPQAIVWFNGKTQWSYQMAMNPYTFINIYKTGYKMNMKKSGNNYQVHLTAQNQKRSVAELYITINQKTYVPSQVKMRQGKTWSTIKVSNFKARSIPNSSFAFNAKEFPSAEVIDLR